MYDATFGIWELDGTFRWEYQMGIVGNVCGIQWLAAIYLVRNWTPEFVYHNISSSSPQLVRLGK